MTKLAKSNDEQRPVVGIDADARGIAWYARYGNGKPDHVGFLHRSHKSHGMYEDYPVDLAQFVEACKARRAVVYIEDVFFMRNVAGFRSLCAVHAEFMYEIIRQSAQFDVEVHYVKPDRWRSVVYGKLGMDGWKKDVKAAAATAVGVLMPGVTFKSEHEMEACCIAHYGVEHRAGLVEDLS